MKAENWLEDLTAVSFRLELFSSAHQRSLVGTETNVCNHYATGTCCHFNAEDMVVHEFCDFSLHDQLTIDFMHQVSQLLEYFFISSKGCWEKYLSLNCTVAGLAPTRLRWCTLLKSSKTERISFWLSNLPVNDEILNENFSQNHPRLGRYCSFVFQNCFIPPLWRTILCQSNQSLKT